MKVKKIKKTRIGTIFVSFLLLCAMVMNIVGCSGFLAKTHAENSKADGILMDFALRLLRASEEEGKNALISPLSLLYALAMTANGARGETREQMETLTGMTVEEWNSYLSSYRQCLPKAKKGENLVLHLANSIWFNDSKEFTINQNFLQTNADYYEAAVYKTSFNIQTCKDINNWVKKNTDGMIPAILEEISPEDIMYLVNALVFDANWRIFYSETEEGMFTREDGERQNVQFMRGTENSYLEYKKAAGFMKLYEGGKCSFVALLPKEGVSMSEYIASLDGQTLNALLKNPKDTPVETLLPKFEIEYGAEMSKILEKMGMSRAFDPNEAEFEGLGTSTSGNIFISRILHKTFFSVGEKGTRAGAVTIVGVNEGSPYTVPNQRKQVVLDRPFVYMLIDCERAIPLFIGTMEDMKQ